MITVCEEIIMDKRLILDYTYDVTSEIYNLESWWDWYWQVEHTLFRGFTVTKRHQIIKDSESFGKEE